MMCLPNRVAESFSPSAPTTRSMRVRTARLLDVSTSAVARAASSKELPEVGNYM